MSGAAEGKKLAKIKISPKNQLKTKNFKKRRSFPTVLDDFMVGGGSPLKIVPYLPPFPS